MIRDCSTHFSWPYASRNAQSGIEKTQSKNNIIFFLIILIEIIKINHLIHNVINNYESGCFLSLVRHMIFFLQFAFECCFLFALCLNHFIIVSLWRDKHFLYLQKLL